MSAAHDAGDAPSESRWLERRHPDVVATELASAGSRGVLLGVKANIAVAGLHCSAASPGLARFPAPVDAPIVAALRHSGAVVAGTTNMHELAFGVTSQNAAYGPVAVPGEPTRSAGGSSGGSAAVVASGEVALALGTDTGGSVSIPASHCGIVGFRPSIGRWPTAGIVGLSWTRDTPGIFARELAVVSAIDALLTGPHPVATDPEARRPRLGVPTGLVSHLHEDTQRAWDRAVNDLSAVADLVPVGLDDIAAGVHGIVGDLMGWESPRALAAAAALALGLSPDAAFARLRADVVSPDVQRVLDGMVAVPVSAAAYEAVQETVAQLRARYDELLRHARLDALVFPATPAPAPPLTVGPTIRHRGESVSVFELYTRNTEHGTVIGAPMVTLPLPVAPAAPAVGMTLQGPRMGDTETLRLAARCARAVASPAASPTG